MVNNKPKFTYIIPYFDETSTMRAPYTICKGFVSAGWNVDISTITRPENANIENAWDQVPVRKVDGLNNKHKLLKLSLGLIKKRDDHVVMSWVWYWHCFALLISKILFKSPYVLVLDTYTHFAPWDLNGLLSKIRLELRYGLVMRYADLILAESPLSYEQAKRHIKGPEIFLIPICFWEQDLRGVEEKWERENFQPKREQVIFFAGRITPQKNIHHMIEAFSRLVNKFPDWRLVIRGPASDPSYLASLQDLARQKSLDDRICFLPSLSGESLYRRYRSSSIYCLPSEWEGIPTTIQEAMYFGGAIIASASGAIPYQLDNGKCGLLFDPGDIESLTDHLDNLMSSESEREYYMNEARERLLRYFTWEIYFNLVENKFMNLAES